MLAGTDDLRLAHSLADTASAIAMRAFQQQRFRVQTKHDGSPVTEADRVIESALRARLLRQRPADTVVGEESGTHGGGARRWFIDPIDGTAGFVAGRADWRTLIATEEGGTIIMGLVSAPALHRRWWATHEGGAWTRRYDEATGPGPTRLTVTGTSRLSQATVAIWPPVPAGRERSLRPSVARLMAGSSRPEPQRSSPVHGCHHGALLVAAGQIDAFLFIGGGPWDIAAFASIVDEAGGRFSDVTGGRALDTRTALFSNGVLHEQILRCLHPARR
jgi:histidinol-phosphatase